MSVKTVKDIDVKGKKVFVRVDFNVPLKKDGTITDDTRIKAAIPTLQYILEQGGSLILASHLGRPSDAKEPEFSLKQIVPTVSNALGTNVKFVEDCVGELAENAAKALKPGEVLLLENTRYHNEEKKNDTDFAKKLASLADVYVNDAFGTAHRAHASTEGVAHLLPAVAGLLMEKECRFFDMVLKNPAKPMTAIIGGAKVSSKIGVLEALLEHCSSFIIGGAMASTFLKMQGAEIGMSKVEDDYLDVARSFIQKAEKKGAKVYIPVDQVASTEFGEAGRIEIVDAKSCPKDMMTLDIGPKTIEMLRPVIKGAATIIWNGPMGVFEMPSFAKGTEAVAQMVAECSGTTVIGGGDSVAAVNQYKLGDKMSHVSTGGGASLEYLEGKVLPGVAILRK